MGGLRAERHDKAGEYESEFVPRDRARGWRPTSGRERGGRVGRRVGGLYPRRHALTPQSRQSRSGNLLSADHGGAQSLVGIDGTANVGGYGEPSRFFLRVSARSRLRRWTSRPKRAAIARMTCGSVRSDFAAFNSSTKAMTSTDT